MTLAEPAQNQFPSSSATLTAPPDITPSQARELCRIAQEDAGLNLDPEKMDFLVFRLNRRLRALGIRNATDYFTFLEQDGSRNERRHLVEALTTHTTDFFRERHHYDWIENEGLDRLKSDGAGFDRPLVIWSAACSTGAELWSAGIVAEEAGKKPSGLRRFLLVGTDISTAILKKAKGATYFDEEMGGLGDAERSRYFMRSRAPVDGSGRHAYRVIPELRSRARFGKGNLTDLSELEWFDADIAFLRNVLIYFNSELQTKVLDGVISRIRRGGFLITGHAESVSARPDLRPLGHSIYERI